jgi:hypothetical protein
MLTACIVSVRYHIEFAVVESEIALKERHGELCESNEHNSQVVTRSYIASAHCTTYICQLTIFYRRELLASTVLKSSP